MPSPTWACTRRMPEATVRSLAGQGLAERTPAASLGKYRITAEGRAWLAAYAPPGPGGA